MKSLALLASAALLLAGCTYPLTCSSTWFRTCAPPQAEVAVPLTAEVNGLPFRFVVSRGRLIVSVPDMPDGLWLVEARRGKEVLGSMRVTVPPRTSMTEIEIWPSPGRSIGLDAYPVFERIEQ